MTLILNIETATNVCSVSLTKDGQSIGIKESHEEKTHAKSITIFIDELLNRNNLSPQDIDAVAVSKGPGSYTGLRIGVSTAKGLCYATEAKLIAISTLQEMAFGLIKKLQNQEINIAEKDDILLCPMIDARRMEVYSALFNRNGNFVREVKAEIIDSNSFSELLKDKKIIFFGDGADKLTDTIKNKNAVFIKDFSPSAEYMNKLSEIAFKNQDFVDIAYFEPFYLKDFIATKPRKNIFK